MRLFSRAMSRHSNKMERQARSCDSQRTNIGSKLRELVGAVDEVHIGQHVIEQVLHALDVILAVINHQRRREIDLLMLLEVERAAVLELRRHQADERNLGGAALRSVLLNRGTNLELMRSENADRREHFA